MRSTIGARLDQVAYQVAEAKPRRTTVKAGALREAERARSLRRRSIAANISCCSTTALSGVLLTVSSRVGRASARSSTCPACASM